VNRLVRFFLLLVFGTIVSFGYSQTNSLRKKISISVKNERIETVLYRISKAADFNFSYNSDIVPLDSVVSLNIVNTEVVKILNTMLGEEYSYKIAGRHVIIVRKNNSRQNKGEKTTYTITGFVYDRETGERITRATVYDLNKLESALSDSMGQFRIKVTPRADYIGLGISRKEYLDTIIYIRPTEKNNININLKRKEEHLERMMPKGINPLAYNNVDNLSIVKDIVSEEMMIHANNIDISENSIGQISILPNIGTNMKISGAMVNRVSVNLFAGYSGGVRGVEMGGFINIIKNNVEGVQMAGFGNITGKNTNGVQMAGFFNNNRGKVKGLQMAGFSNTGFDTIQGVQLAGFCNILNGNMNGLQLSGFTNIVTKDVEAIQITGFTNLALGNCKGMQMAGFANYVERNNSGLQVSGFSNVVMQNNKGSQIAGFANYTRGDQDGAQISGFLNYAKRVNGFRFAAINVADTVSGLSIGLINFVRKGYFAFGSSYDEISAGNLTFMMGSYKFYNIFGIMKRLAPNSETWGITYGVGGIFRARKKVFYNIDFIDTQFFQYKKIERKDCSKMQLATNINIRLYKKLSINAGPTLNTFMTDNLDTALQDYVTDIAPHIFYDDRFLSVRFQMWFGWTAGLKLDI